MYRDCCFGICLVVVTLMSGASSASTPPPPQAYSHLPQAENLAISPDGKYIAYTLNTEDGTMLVTLDLDKRKTHGITRSDNEKFKFNWLRWASPEKLIFSIYFPHFRGLGVDTTETRLLSVDPTGGEPKTLFRPGRKSPTSYKHYSQIQDDVISVLPEEHDRILMGFDTDSPTYPSVYSVDVNTGSKTIVRRAKPPIRGWIADRQGRVRAGIGYDEDDGVRSVWVLDLETDDWNKLWEYKYFSQPDITPMGFSVDPNVLYIRADHNGRQAIFTIDTRDASPQMQLVVGDPDYDIEGGLIYSPKTNDAVGVSHGEADNSVIYWDEVYEGYQRTIDTALLDTSNHLLSFSDNELRYIVYASSHNMPGVYYYGNRISNTLEPIIQQYPELMAEKLPGSRKVSYKARDGLEIEAYLTLPANFDGKPIPAIVHPHGGPMVREYGGFDYWTQFFVSRGYAVLQPNFRGSSGYGHDFQMQAVGQYGEAMQDDLVDGTRWLVTEGIADSERICIVGASYGGYAALLAAAETPKLFQCAISFAGVSDLLAQRNRSRHYINKVVAFDQYGRDSTQLEMNSPVNLVEKITIPILLVHGEKDRVVDVEQSREMAEELDEHGKTFEYMELEHGTHYLDNHQHRTALFEAMDAFLQRYLGS